MTKASATIDVDALKVAGEGASKYITHIDEGGIKVHDSDNENNYTQIDSSGMSIYQNIENIPEKVAVFGAGSAQIGRVGHAQVNIGSNTLSLSNEAGKCFEVTYNSDSSSSSTSTTPEKEDSWAGIIANGTGDQIQYETSIIARAGSFSVGENYSSRQFRVLAYIPIGTGTTASVISKSEGLMSSTSDGAVYLQVIEGNNSFTAGVAKTVTYSAQLSFTNNSTTRMAYIGMIIQYVPTENKIIMTVGAGQGGAPYPLALKVHFPSINYAGYEFPVALHLGSWDADIIEEENKFGSTIGAGLIPNHEGFAIGKFNRGDSYSLLEIGAGNSINSRKNVLTVTEDTIYLENDTYIRGDSPDNGSLLSPIGTIVMFAGSTAPTGWLLCQGQAVSRTTYAGLFAIIGTTYGTGDGSTTFNLPDFRGRVGVGVGTGTATGATEHTLNQKAGEETHILTPAETAMKSHDHVIKYNVIDWKNGTGTSKSCRNVVASGSSSASTENTTAANGSAHNNMPPYIGINYIICAQ